MPRVRPAQIRRLLVAAFLCLGTAIPLSATGTPGTRPDRPQAEVLFLSFLDPDLADVAALIEEVQTQILEGRDTPVHFTLEYLDPTILGTDSSRQKKVLAFLKDKHSGQSFDLVIAIGGGPDVFEEFSRAKLFPDASSLFFFINPQDGSKTFKPPSNATGVVLSLNYIPTLQLALRQNAGTRHIVVVSGSSDPEQLAVKVAREQFTAYESSVDFQYWTHLKFAELRTRLVAVDPDSVVFFFDFLEDASGEQFTPDRVLRTVTKNSNRPIYGSYLSFVGNGVVGGHVIDLHEVGRILGRQGARVLNGEKPENIPTETGEFQRDVFDWRQLHRWGISEDQLPPGSSVLYWEYSPWELYRRKILGLIALIALETALIVLLLWNRARRKSAEESLRRKEDELSEAQRLAEIGSWQWDLQNDTVTASDTLCSLLGLGPESTPKSFEQLGRFFVPESRQQLTDSIDKVRRTGSSCELELEALRPDGIRTWISARGEAVRDASGRIVQLRGTMQNITDEKEAKAALTEFGTKLIHLQEQERTRIARELHDDINQRLALLANGLQELAQTSEPAGKHGQNQLLELWQLTSEVATDIQHLSHQLHPSKLQYLGLGAAARDLCGEFSRQYKIKVECILRDLPHDLDETASLSLFRTIQEALRNVAKHSQARHAKVELTGQPNVVRLKVSDDGIGFDPDSAKYDQGLGLISMRERLKSVGGDLFIISQPSLGTQVEGYVPANAKRARSA